MLSVIARAELDRPWDEVLERLAPLALVAAEARPGGGQAWLEVGVGADPIQVDLCEGLILAQARSGPWGPGYHQAVVKALDALGARIGGWLHVTDTSGYYAQRSRERLERTFLRVAAALWDPDLGDYAQGILVGLDPSQAPARVPPGMVATPTGFKDARWLTEVRRALIAAQVQPQRTLSGVAREAFLWWSETPDALDWVQLGRMLCACEVIWRPLAGDSADTPAQVEVRQRALSCFLRARRLDPAAPVPRAEFRRLADLLGSDEQLALGEDQDPPFQGGYREGYIRHRVGDAWRVRLPGWLRAGYDAGDGHDVFWDGRFTVHLTPTREAGPFQREAEVARHLQCLPSLSRARARVLPIDQGAIQGYAIVLEGPSLEHLAGIGPAKMLVLGQVAAGDERINFTALSQCEETAPLALRLPGAFSLR